MKLCILIPVYDAEQSIEQLVSELVEEIGPRYVLEIVLVNDCSKDQSELACIRLFEKYPDIVRFYSLSRNVGEHNAVMAGLHKTTGDYVVIMDDDLQNPLKGILELLEIASKNDFDVVYSYYNKKRHSLFRNFGSWVNDQAANLILNKPRDLYLSSFKVINRFLVDEIIQNQSPFPYIDGLILQVTDRIGKVKVEHLERSTGKSGYNLRKLISLWLNMFTSFSVLPLRISTILGFFFSLLSLVLAVYVIQEKLSHPSLPLGYASLIVTLSFLAGVQLMVVGIVGEYVGRIFLSINQKPQFTIRKSYESSGKKVPNLLHE